jgi:hypothetical protein
MRCNYLHTRNDFEDLEEDHCSDNFAKSGWRSLREAPRVSREGHKQHSNWLYRGIMNDATTRLR